MKIQRSFLCVTTLVVVSGLFVPQAFADSELVFRSPLEFRTVPNYSNYGPAQYGSYYGAGRQDFPWLTAIPLVLQILDQFGVDVPDIGIPGMGGGKTDLSKLESTMGRIEGKVTELEKLINERVKKNEDDIAELVKSQEEIANRLDEKIDSVNNDLLKGIKSAQETLLLENKRLEIDTYKSRLTILKEIEKTSSTPDVKALISAHEKKLQDLESDSTDN